MSTYSSILAWEIPWIEEPGRLQYMGLQRVGYNLVTKQQRSVFHILISFIFSATVVAQLVKNLPTMQEIWVGKIPQKGKGYPLQYSGLENSKGCIFHGVTKSHIRLSNFHFGGSDGKESVCNVGVLGSIPALGRCPRGRHGNPLQYSCLENLHGWRSLVGHSPWGHKESDMTAHSTVYNEFL